MANLGNTIINGILRVNGKLNVGESITAPSFIGNLTGNADTATKLATARNINGVAFDGTKDITINSSDNTKLPLAGGTMTGTISTALNGSWTEGSTGAKAIIKSTSIGDAHTALWSAASTNGRFQLFKYGTYMGFGYHSNDRISAGTNSINFGAYFNEQGSFYPLINNSQTLGTPTQKWNNVYATNFTGLASNATSDASGNNIANTYLRKDSVDSALSSTSTNPVQNKVINTALAGKAPTSHSHTYLSIQAPTDGVNTGNSGSVTRFGIQETRACKSAFLPPEAVKVEYTTDGGTTWVDYEATDTQKKELVACRRISGIFKYGGASCTEATDKIGLRITYSATDRYCQVDMAYMWVNVPRTFV